MDSTAPAGRPARSARSPLYDVTNRLNSESLEHLHDQIKRKSYRAPEVAAILGEGPVGLDEHDMAVRHSSMMSAQNNRRSLARDQPIPEDVAMTAEDLQESPADGPDSSIVFNARSSGGQKTHIGPWQLGKTLGKGSTGMVRLCRHRVSHELAAVKIVSKNSRKIVQAGSIYGLDRWDNKLPEKINGEMRIPIAIEREVAILKLIQHPNIMKLYDIWENRKEIYLVLEYVDHGDLFSYITRHGRLSEEGALHFYRQIMSALSYCHAFNICHRDLKPENILLTSENQVKIADFSMAALHQTSAHRLHTACGSPHYAAPELLSGKKYKGDKADIWSMGIILYAMLASCLPFDDPDLTFMMELVKKGEYDMPEFLSLEAKDLLRRILQVNPDRRISMKEMWRHPLVQKYDYMDDYQPENKHPTDIRKEFKHRPFRADEIDPQLVRQLRSLWHMFTEDELKVALMSHETNEQKMFYWLLQRYRERQLENFNPEIVHSRSDYHHLKPSSGWKERRTTCEFANPEGRFGRSVSRFTVISNVAQSEETAPSYDPYRPSNSPAQPRDSHTGSTRVTIHRQKSNLSRKDGKPASHDTKLNRHSTKSAPESTRRPKPKPVARLSSIQGTASSLNSIPSRNSRQGSPYVRNAKLRRKRKVDFSQIRAPKAPCKNQDQQDSPRWDVRGGSVYVEPNPGVPRPDSGVLPVRGSRASNKPIRKKPCVPRIVKHRESEAISNDELRKFSSSLAKDCDAAFGTSLMAEPSVGASILDIRPVSQESSPLALRFPSSPLLDRLGYPSPPSDCEEWLNRPLPPLPLSAGAHTPPSTVPDARDSRGSKQDSKRESGESENQKQGRIVSQLNRLSMPILSSKEDRRIASAPAAPAHDRRLASMFSSRGGKRGAIMVALDEQDRGRIVSYPAECVRSPQGGQNGRDELSRVGYTIDVSDSSHRFQTSVYSGHQSTYLEVGIQEQQRPQTSAYTGSKSMHRDAGSQQQQPRPQSNAFTGPPSTHIEAGTRERVSLPRHKKTASTSSTGSARSATKKKPSWFLNKKQETVENGPASAQVSEERVEAQTQTQPQKLPLPAVDAEAPRSNWSDSTDPPSPAPRKKKKFGLLFWKSKSNTKMSIAGPEYGDSPTITPMNQDAENAKRQSQASCGVEEAVGQRSIVTHHNWLARLFRVKPVTEHLCFSISRKRARQEVTLILRQWRKYGIRDIQVDRQRNIIFARVGPKNYLGMKEVSFAVEIMAVIEHGNPEMLSIARFTQERGAASTMRRLAETMREVFEVRRLLVADKQKAKMMVKTVNA